LPTEQFQAVPGIVKWLDKVFCVTGGQVYHRALDVPRRSNCLRERRRAVVAVASFAGLSSLGLMAVVNFLIDSDFKWLILTFALLWAGALALFIGCT